MQDLSLTEHATSPLKYYTRAISYEPTIQDLEYFDQNGYDLTPIEARYARHNDFNYIELHRQHICLRLDWMTQPIKTCGAVLNHCNLFERKGVDDEAREQVIKWAKRIPLLWKIANIRPKWGLDFSIDYCDVQGNCFEILHWEWDTFDWNEHCDKKQMYESKLASMDWDDAGKQILQKKHEWYDLNFEEQSEWKCKYFGIEKERFKMVLWV